MAFDEEGPEIWSDPDLEDFGLTANDLEREFSGGSAVVWKDIRNPTPRATVGVSSTEAWDQAKIEFKFLRDKLEKETGTRKPTFESIFDLILGKSGGLYNLFLDAGIITDYDGWRRFLAAYFLSSSHQVSCKQLYDKYSRIDKTGAMDKEEYLATWQAIGKACLPRNQNLTPAGMVPFWMKLEDVMNRYKRDLFIQNIPGKLQTTLDDDKPKTTANNYSAGLKVMRHTKANVNGHTVHTLVLSFSQCVIQISWEREVHDSSEVATTRIFGNGVAPMAAAGQPGDLRNVSIGMDRGYWSKSLIHDYFMRSGANIKASTVKRQPCIPFTGHRRFQQKFRFRFRFRSWSLCWLGDK